MSSNRLSGHSLRSEGKPFVWTKNGGRYVRTEGYQGVGLCSCGAHSKPLDFDNERKRWHRDVHKPEVIARKDS
jgi:hypothetical protein